MTATDTVPIVWPAVALPDDDATQAARQILANATRYTAGVWFPGKAHPRWHPGSVYLNLGGTDEIHIRPPAMQALALAVALRSGAYDPVAAGISTVVARGQATALIRSLAYHHHATTGVSGWGAGWQTALWATQAGMAGWLLWDYLTGTARGQITAMVTAEADRLSMTTVPYYRRLDGTIVTPGDSKCEENAWNAGLLELAASMMPNHPRRGAWQAKSLEYMVSAYSRPADASSAIVVNGKPLSQWLRGSNAEPNGMVVNHGKLHPDYATAATALTRSVLARTLARQATPEAALFGVDRVYAALVDLEWTTGQIYPPGAPVLPPGGTIYMRDGLGQPTADVYYPQGSDWTQGHLGRRIQMLLLDVHAHLYGRDGLVSIGGDVWAQVHAAEVLAMQARGTDGRTYQAPEEDTYGEREALLAEQAAALLLSYWLAGWPGGWRWASGGPGTY